MYMYIETYINLTTLKIIQIIHLGKIWNLEA